MTSKQNITVIPPLRVFRHVCPTDLFRLLRLVVFQVWSQEQACEYHDSEMHRQESGLALLLNKPTAADPHPKISSVLARQMLDTIVPSWVPN